MTTSLAEFNLPRLERVISGANAADGLGAELERLGASRAVIVTGRTLGASPLLARLTRPLGDRCVLVFREARQHVPAGSVADLVRAIEQSGADCLISFGGGSPIDTVKAAIHTLMSAGGSRGTAAVDGLAHVALPTTLSAGEFTAVAGVTDEHTRVKHAISDPRLAPRTVILDPTLTLETPAWLWMATGVRAFDHAVETLYSTHSHPVSDALASRGLSMLVEHLPPSTGGAAERQIEHRTQCQLAAWMCVFGIANAGLGLSHALGHQIGPRWDVPHGVTSCITLPHAMRAVAARAPERFRWIAEGLGLAFDGANPEPGALACADRTAAFIAALGLPGRLRDVNVPRGEIADVARVVSEVMGQAPLVGQPVTRDEVASVLAAAY